MLRSLRVRFALSHTLPILLLVPLLSLLLLYLLQTRYFLDTLAEELVVQAEMLAGLARQEDMFSREPAVAQAYLAGVSAEMTARVMLIDPSGRIFVSAPPESADPGTPIELDLVADALEGATAWQTRYSVNMHDEVVEVVVPVRDARGTVVGVVRLSQSLAGVESRLRMLTWYIVIVFSFGILAALTLALFLARTVGIHLLRLTQAVDRLAGAPEPAPVPERGPEELRRLAATYNRMAAQLTEQRRLRRHLLAGVVHEMGRPLGGINAAAQYLMRNQADVPPALIGELSEDIVQQVDQMSRQIDDLALVSQALNEAIELHPEPASLAELCAEAVRHVRARAQAKALTIDMNVDPATPPVLADSRRVIQIIGNLLSNAVKFSPHGGRIDVAIRPRTAPGCPPQVELSVRDMGPGIDPADRAHIFDYFFRSPEQRPLQEGMGLGLAISAQLATAQGGTLHVESEPGAGATFYLRLPQDRTGHTSPSGSA